MTTLPKKYSQQAIADIPVRLPKGHFIGGKLFSNIFKINTGGLISPSNCWSGNVTCFLLIGNIKQIIHASGEVICNALIPLRSE